MKILQCSRHMGMKYYAEEELPLMKISNKYYIDRKVLFEWIKFKNDQRNKQDFISLVLGIVSIIIIIFIVSNLRM